MEGERLSLIEDLEREKWGKDTFQDDHQRNGGLPAVSKTT